MTLIDRLKKIAIFVMNRRKSIFSIPVSKQEYFLNKMPMPQNDIERSYYQYKCQCYLKGKSVVFAQNMASIFLLPYYRARYQKNATKKIVPEVYDAVFIHEDKPKNILPDEVAVEYKRMKYNHECVPILDKSDIDFLNKITKGSRFSFFYIFRCMNDIAEYSAVIKKHAPQAIITCSEYSFTSSILTAYCEEKNIIHIDVMHGEKLFYIRDSFFRFHSCCIWDMHYKYLFTKMKAYEGQFSIYTPESIGNQCIEGEILYDYIYYLGAEGKEQLERINEILLRVRKRMNKNVCVRPHPRYSNMELVSQIFKEIPIEDTKSISIEKSLSSTNGAISLYSTVLLQAYNKGLAIVIDDMTCRELYEQLKEMDYIMLNKNHACLSDVIRNEE